MMTSFPAFFVFRTSNHITTVAVLNGGCRRVSLRLSVVESICLGLILGIFQHRAHVELEKPYT